MSNDFFNNHPMLGSVFDFNHDGSMSSGEAGAMGAIGGMFASENGLKWDMRTMTEADVSCLDGQAVMALLVGAVRADHFSGGTLLEFFKAGCIKRWLRRLQEIDE